MLQRRRQDAPQTLGEFLGRIMCKSREYHMLEFSSLLGNGFRDQRMRVTMEIHPPGGDRVDQLPAVARIQINAFASLDGNGFRIERFLRKWMPDGQ